MPVRESTWPVATAPGSDVALQPVYYSCAKLPDPLPLTDTKYLQRIFKIARDFILRVLLVGEGHEIRVTFRSIFLQKESEKVHLELLVNQS